MVLPQPETLHMVPAGTQEEGRATGCTYWLRVAGVFSLISMMSFSRLQALKLGWRITLEEEIHCSVPSYTRRSCSPRRTKMRLKGEQRESSQEAQDLRTRS